jgi:hypothetical protein
VTGSIMPDLPPPDVPTLEEIRDAAQRISEDVLRTPLVRLAGTSDPAIWLKLENLQSTNSFKIRGALSAITALPPDERSKGAWTASTGNAGQGVAYAARQAGVPATVLAVDTAPETKLDRMRHLGAEVRDVKIRSGEVVLETTAGDVRASFMVNCAGLYSDRLARMAGVEPGIQIVPFRGEYFELVPERSGLVRGLIYPVPDPGFPFLGVHLTRTVDGGVHAGPNAVLALAREGYRTSTVDPSEALEALTYPGFLRLASRHWRKGAREVARSLSRERFTRSLQRLVPAVESDDLVPAPAGVRAQALSRSGELVDDFLLVEGPRSLHVCNAPSPAATASLPIGAEIARRIPIERSVGPIRVLTSTE